MLRCQRPAPAGHGYGWSQSCCAFVSSLVASGLWGSSQTDFAGRKPRCAGSARSVASARQLGTATFARHGTSDARHAGTPSPLDKPPILPALLGTCQERLAAVGYRHLQRQAWHWLLNFTSLCRAPTLMRRSPIGMSTSAVTRWATWVSSTQSPCTAVRYGRDQSKAEGSGIAVLELQMNCHSKGWLTVKESKDLVDMRRQLNFIYGPLLSFDIDDVDRAVWIFSYVRNSASREASAFYRHTWAEVLCFLKQTFLPCF